MTERESSLAVYHQRIPEAYRSRGWRVLSIAISYGEAEGGIGPTLYAVRLTNSSVRGGRYVDSVVRHSREDAVDDAVRELMRLEPLE